MNARSCLALLAVAFLGGNGFAAENDLPRRQPGEPAEAGAALLFQDLGDVLPGKELPNLETLAPEPDLDVERAKAELERAQRKEQRWQKLAKAGVLARVEAETCVLATARARARYEAARVAEQERALGELRQRAAGGQLSADAVASAESALKTAQAMAAEASTAFQRTQLTLAETNVERQRRLLALGAGSKTQLKRAESILSQIKGPPR
jgi:multidrug resistance efflux pump